MEVEWYLNMEIYTKYAKEELILMIEQVPEMFIKYGVLTEIMFNY